MQAEQTKEISLKGHYSDTLSSLKEVIAKGNLSLLTDEDKLRYYAAVCESVGLNPLTRPFEFIELQGKLVMYARKDCTEQLRKIHGISCERVDHKKEDGIYIVTVTLKDKSGRTDIATGAIPIGPSDKGNQLANLIMKTETKAKRRATLSLCGLGLLDETELETIPKNQISNRNSSIDTEYKLKENTENENYITEDQLNEIKSLLKILNKEEDENEINIYICKVVKSRCGHSDVMKISYVDADNWIKSINKKIDGNIK